MITGSFAVVLLLFFMVIVATPARARLAARIAGAPEELPVVSTRMPVTPFHIAMPAMGLYLMIAVGIQSLNGVTGAGTVVGPAVGALGTPADLPAGADRS